MTTCALKSPLKYAGGKSWLVPQLRAIYEPHCHRRLVEPFVGGMSVALGLRPERALLADVSPYLVNLYAQIKRGLVCDLQMENDEALYYAHRERFNALARAGIWYTAEIAQLFYFLNRTGFNGLCRFNKSGEFNVPFGRYKTINYRRDFSEYTESLRYWDISRCSYEYLIVYEEDFIYADPPYDTEFTAYSSGGFSWEDQVRVATRLAGHPGPVVLSNQATLRVAELYRDLGYDVALVDAPRRISSDGDRRSVKEVLATRNVSNNVAKIIDIGNAFRVTVLDATRDPEISDSSDSSDNTNTEDGDDNMANLPPEMAEQVGKARSAGGGNYIQHGDYVFMIKKWFFQKIQDRCIILELIPVEARKKVVYEGTKAVEQEPNAVGSECSDTANFDGEGKLSAPANSRAPVLALFGYKEGEVKDEVVMTTLDDVVGQSQPAAGMLIACSTFPKEKRSKKGEFITGRNYDCVAKPGTGLNAPDAVKARMDAYKIGPEELVRVAAEQLRVARASGAAPALVSAQQAAPPQPAPPGPPPPQPAPPPPAVDPIKVALASGWKEHPSAPDYLYRGEGAAYETKLKSAFSA